MMTPLRAYSSLLQVYEFVTQCEKGKKVEEWEILKKGIESLVGDQGEKGLAANFPKMPKTFVKFKKGKKGRRSKA